jgi:hypothetical protein
VRHVGEEPLHCVACGASALRGSLAIADRRTEFDEHVRQRDRQVGAGRRREVLTAEIDSDAEPGADAWLDDQEATLTELAACIRPLVDALPTYYRRALELTDFEGRTQSDAADIEGISLSGMKSRVQRGRRQFATLVRQCCDVTTDSRGELVDFDLRTDGFGCPPANS